MWCRTADGSALARHVSTRGRAFGELEHLTVRFDDRVDPGPPTADLFEPARARTPRGEPLPEPTASTLTEIGRIVVRVEFDYRVVTAERDGDAWHVRVEPRRDPERNRLRELWFDAQTLMLRRVVLADHLYTANATIPERFDVRLAPAGAFPIVTAIHGQTDRAAMHRNDPGYDLPTHQVDYTFTDVAFPATLPGWYFEPATYGPHRAEAPG